MKKFKIYCIEDINGNKYIGSTGQPLNTRLLGHKWNNNCSSNKLNLYNSFIYTIEECDEHDRKEREKYWINNTECVNIRKLNYDHNACTKQWNIDNRDKVREYKKQWYIDNTDKKKQLRNYKNSWGGDKRSNNNLLLIDIDIFH